MDELIECYGTGDEETANEETANEETETAQPVIKPVLQTEDTGKIFEMAICVSYNIPFDGKYKYKQPPESLVNRLKPLTELFPNCQHTAKKGARYDFTSSTDPTKHLSAKTTKKGGGKVAPQVIGQCQPTKFCETLGIEFTTIPDLKRYIQTNATSILPVLVEYTFDCPNLYYNQEKDTIRYITLIQPIDWTSIQVKWTCKWEEWENSSTMKVVYDETHDLALIEFQFHTKSRTNMAIRWCYENFLTIFNKNMHIVHL